jgi:TRAP-type C4-dicarboxylate transport system permease small subunit
LLSRILDRVLTGMAVLAALLLLFITFSISYSIFTRFVGLPSPVWTVQFNEYSLLWMTFLGSAWVLSRRKHVSMDVITGRLKPPARRITDIAHSLMGIAVCGVLCWYSSLMTLNFFQRGVTDVQAVDVPKHLVLIVIPFGFLILGIQFARNLAAAFGSTEADRGISTSETGAGEPPGSERERETAGERKSR